MEIVKEFNYLRHFDVVPVALLPATHNTKNTSVEGNTVSAVMRTRYTVALTLYAVLTSTPDLQWSATRPCGKIH